MEQTQKGLLLAKIESVYGTDAAPTGAANTIAVVRSAVSFEIEHERVPREILNGTWERASGFNLLRTAKMSFRVEARGNYTTGGTDTDITSGASAQAIEIDCLLRACDLTPTYTAETSNGARDGYVIYKPAEPEDEGASATLWFYTGGKVHKMTGAKGNVKAVFEAGKMAYLDFEFRGLYVAAADASLPGTITLLATKPPLFGSASLTVGSFAAIIKTLTFDLGNQVVRREDANAANGIKGFAVVNRMMKVTIDPETVTEAAQPWFGDFQTPTSRTITWTLGSVGGNKALFSAVGESEAISYGDRSGLRTNQITYDLVRAALSDAANGLFSVKFF